MMITLFELIIYILAGFAAGLLGGLLGVGGGLITVPTLLFIFHFLGFSSPYLMQMAIGTSLAAMILTSAASAWTHYLKQGINWLIFREFIPGIIIGSILGALIASHLSSRTLEIIFGVSIILVGSYLLLIKSMPEQKESPVLPVHPLLFPMIGILIGAISTILGIGGGLITVPVLIFYGISMRQAISSSAISGFVISLIGTISFLLIGFHQTILRYSLGFVYLPAFLIIGLASCLTAPLGAELVYRLPTSLLRQIFGLFLILVGTWMIKS